MLKVFPIIVPLPSWSNIGMVFAGAGGTNQYKQHKDSFASVLKEFPQLTLEIVFAVVGLPQAIDTLLAVFPGNLIKTFDSGLTLAFIKYDPRRLDTDRILWKTNGVAVEFLDAVQSTIKRV